MDHTLGNGNGTISMHSPVPDFFVRWRKFSRRFNLLTWVIISFLMLREIIPEANEKAVKDIKKISEYELSKLYPSDFKGSMPSIEEIEQQLK